MDNQYCEKCLVTGRIGVQVTTQCSDASGHRFVPTPASGKGGAESGGDAVPARISQWKKIAPSTFAKHWSDHQMHGSPWLYCHRPYTAYSTPAVLIYKVFGQFCDDATSIEPDELSHQFVLNLIEPMSASYKDTTGSTARKAVSRSLGSSHTGTSGGHELTRASIFRHHLLAYLKVALPSIGIDTLEPTQVDKSTAINDGSLRVFDAQGRVLFHILFLEVKEDTGGGNPAMEIGAYYGRFIYDQYSKPEGPAAAVLCTCCPAFGLELSGNIFRIHALYLTDGVCMEPLTPGMHLSNLLGTHTEGLARIFKALALGLEKLFHLYKKVEQMPVGGLEATRNSLLVSGAPYFLRDKRFSAEGVTRLVDDDPQKQIFLCKDASGSKRVVKVVGSHTCPAGYPSQLHRELARIGLMPRLLKVQVIPGIPGGYSVVRMAYLAPEDGWKRLDHVPTPNPAIASACEAALVKLHACLGGSAVHGDLRPPNIFVKEEEVKRNTEGKKCRSQKRKFGSLGTANETTVEVCFIDIDWGGSTTATPPPRYPFHLNPDIKWPLDKPSRKPIYQEHDIRMLQDTLAEFR